MIDSERLVGFGDRQTNNGFTDIGDYRVALTNENFIFQNFPFFDFLFFRKDTVVIAGTLENIDVQRFRKGQSRKIINEALHPKWEKDIGEVAHIYYDVGLLILDEVCVTF